MYQWLQTRMHPCMYCKEKSLEDPEFPKGIARFPVGRRQADIELILAAVIEKS